MEILPNIEIVDLALYLKKEKILIIADLHIGQEEAMNKQGILIPRFQFKGIESKLKNILDKYKVNKIIINGDLKHEFGIISEQEWRNTLKILDLCLSYAPVILIKGNHDKIIGPITDKRNVQIIDYYKTDEVTILHGDKLKEIKTKIIIIGHEHPAIIISDRIRKEKYKCFLKGKWKNKTLIVMPSFNFITEGTDVANQRLLSPFLKNISNFEVYVIEDKAYNFGKIKNLKWNHTL